MQKRILSFILCAVLICGLFPTTATAMGSQAEYTGVCTHGSHEGYIELTSEYLATHNDTIELQKAQITSLERQLRPSIQKRLKEAQELSDLKDENMALEYELNRQKDLMARLMQRVEAALTFLEEKLPEQFRPYVQRARAHILPEQKQEHRRDRGMSMGGMER